MAYGDYSGPDKADKGKEGGSCNRGRCQCAPARWYNHGTFKWYCDDCARDIGRANLPTFARDTGLDHPQFETRKMMDDRKNPAPQTKKRGTP